MSSSLQPQGLQQARLPCPSPTLRACSNSCPLRQWCHPTISFSVIPFSFSLQSFPTSSSLWVSSSHQVAKVLSLSFSISPFHEYSEFISFRIDLFYLAVQGTLRSLLQHHSSKASILQHSAFFIIQFWHLHMTTHKSIPLTIWTFISHVCLFFLICCLGLSEIFF